MVGWDSGVGGGRVWWGWNAKAGKLRVIFQSSRYPPSTLCKWAAMGLYLDTQSPPVVHQKALFKAHSNVNKTAKQTKNIKSNKNQATQTPKTFIYRKLQNKKEENTRN